MKNTFQFEFKTSKSFECFCTCRHRSVTQNPLSGNERITNGAHESNPSCVVPSVVPECIAHGASLARDDDGGGRCTRSDHTAGERCQSFNGEELRCCSLPPCWRSRTFPYLLSDISVKHSGGEVRGFAAVFLNRFFVKCIHCFFFYKQCVA